MHLADAFIQATYSAFRLFNKINDDCFLIQESLGNIISEKRYDPFNWSRSWIISVPMKTACDISTSKLVTVTALRQHSAAYNSWLLIQLNYLIIQDIIHTETRPRLGLSWPFYGDKTVWTSSAHLYSYPAFNCSLPGHTRLNTGV